MTKNIDKSSNQRSPVFIIGMPRSGTKLVRSILNQHSNICITSYESHFIPYILRKYGNNASFESPKDLKKVFNTIIKTNYMQELKRIGIQLDIDDFLRSVDGSSWNSIFSYVLTRTGPKPYENMELWGDKTPGYVAHMPLLTDIFPNATFIHIIRDPRDYCLSVQKGWGKNLYRAAQRWAVTVGSARSYGETIPNNYKEIHYEDLLADPEACLREVCNFLDCQFELKMLTLDEPTPEDVGDIKGVAEIVRSNTGKYRSQLTQSQIRKIEEIVWPVMKNLPYPFDFEVKSRSQHQFVVAFIRLLDGIAIFRLRTSERGLVNGTKYFINHYIKSSWRKI